MSSTSKEVEINGHPVPQRIWIDFRDEPANRYWRVHTAPNAFAATEYVRSTDAERMVKLESALLGLQMRMLSDGPCFCTDYSKESALSYFENAGARTGHDNGFRHSEECRAARAALQEKG